MVEMNNLIDFLSIGILLTALSMNGLKRLESCIRAYFLNSLFLSLLIVSVAIYKHENHLLFAGILNFLTKCILITIFIRKIIRDMKVTHDVEPLISNSLSLIISGIIIAIVYSAISKGVFVTGFSENTLQISIAIILISLFIMISRKKAITQVIGLLFMENGLFLAGFSLTYGMPLIIEVGIFFDMLMGVIILGIFTVQIKKIFASTDLDKLTKLRG